MRAATGIRAFVETGTSGGGSLAYALRCGMESLHSVERRGRD
jgi:hypothetical protein